MSHFWEFVFTDGPGTVLHHGVDADQRENISALELSGAKAGVSVLVERVSAERYAEFITIHGSEVAV